MPVTDTLVGIDLGTTKISAIIAEVGDDDDVQVVGVGMTPSRGMRRGVVVNIDKTTEAIAQAIDQAEQMAGVKVSEVYVGIAGDHIRSINSRGVIAVARGTTVSYTNVITRNDVERVIDAARAVALPMDREVLHVLPQEFSVDDETGIHEPVGMTGLRLEADVHIITGAIASAQNIYRCVRNAGVHLRGLVLEPLASSYAVLSEEEKDLGVALLDLGGGTTDIAVFYDGSIRHTSVIGFGGTNVTRDIATVLNISIEQAEKIKISHGGVLPPVGDKKPIIVESVGDRVEREVDPKELNEIIRARMEEVFDMVLRELKRVDCMSLLGSGVVITGGGSQLKNTVMLAEEVLRKQVRSGVPRGLNGLAETVHNPAHATGVGLILYGLQNGGDLGFDGDETAVFGKILKLFKSWFKGLMI